MVVLAPVDPILAPTGHWRWHEEVVEYILSPIFCPPLILFDKNLSFFHILGVRYKHQSTQTDVIVYRLIVESMVSEKL